MRTGSVLSVIFHLAIVLLLLFGLPDLFASDEVVVAPVPVELATMADISSAPKSVQTPPKPVVKPADTPPPPAPQAPSPPPTPTPPPPKPVVEAPPPPPEPAPTPPPEPAPPQPQPAQTLPDLPAPEVIPDKTAPPDKPPPEEAKADVPPPPPVLRPPQPPDQAKPKPKPDKKPVQPTQDFNSLLKNLTQSPQTASASDTPPAPAAQPSASASVPNGPPLTASEMDAVKSQIEGNWNVDPGKKGASDIVVEIRVQAGPDGTVIGIPQILDAGRMATDPVFRSIAESARRAIQLSSPLRLPPDKYGTWSDGLLLRFSPQGML